MATHTYTHKVRQIIWRKGSVLFRHTANKVKKVIILSLCAPTHSHLSHQPQWWSMCAPTESVHTHRYTKQSTSWGIAVLAMHGDKSHYYLCTLIKGEGKLFINHTCPRGQETGGRGGGRGSGQRGSEGARDVGDRGAPRPHISQASNTNIKPARSSFPRCKHISGGYTGPVRHLCTCHADIHTHTRMFPRKHAQERCTPLAPRKS